MIPKQAHLYPLLVKEVDLDAYAHVNNATYLRYFEEARWDYITSHGYGYDKIAETGLGPVVLETTIKYLRELRLRDQIVIKSVIFPYEGKIFKMEQKMLRGEEICCTALFTVALFNLQTRKLHAPTSEWLKGIGLES